jgi:hypothetical protein
MSTAVHIQMCVYSCASTDVCLQLYASSCMSTAVTLQLYVYSCAYTDVSTAVCLQLYVYSFASTAVCLQPCLYPSMACYKVNCPLFSPLSTICISQCPLQGLSNWELDAFKFLSQIKYSYNSASHCVAQNIKPYHVSTCCRHEYTLSF